MTPGRATYEYRRPGDPEPSIPWEELALEARDFYEEQFAAGLLAPDPPPMYGALLAERNMLAAALAEAIGGRGPAEEPGSVPWQPVNAACTAAGLGPEYARKVLEAAAPYMHFAPDRGDCMAPVAGTAKHDGVTVTILAPPGTDPDLAGVMARQLAADCHLVRQCCPMGTYDTDSAGDLRPVCSCDDGCDCTCLDCRCRSRLDDEDDG